MIKIASLTIACIILSACESDFETAVEAPSSSGNADFSAFVTLGDSLTAGFADRALSLQGQNNSYPALLAQQFAKAGGGDFSQPLVSDNLGGLLFGGTANPEFGNRLVLNTNPDPSVEGERPAPEPLAGDPTTEVIGSGLNGSVFNNMGVPGAKSFHLGAPGYGNAAGLAIGAANPYFVRFASSPTTTMITDAAAQQPSFFVLWIGNNDVLSFATAGGDGENQLGNLDPSTYGSTDITDPNVFASVYSQFVAAFKTANPDVKGVLVNIPDVSTIPFFTTVPFNPVPLDEATAGALNTAYAAYNGGLAAAQGLGLITAEEAAARTISFAAGQNAVVILDEGLTDITAVNAALINLRQATADDLVILPASAKIGTLADPANPGSARGIGVPLGDGDVLTAEEIAAINTARTAFNTTIEAIADNDDNLLFVDVATLMTELNTSGINFGTGMINSTYASGGAFSLDGVHPTARGYAVIANKIIETINSGFAASVPTVDPAGHSTIFVKVP